VRAGIVGAADRLFVLAHHSTSPLDVAAMLFVLCFSEQRLLYNFGCMNSYRETANRGGLLGER
jgi:hypothetical protein